MEMGQKGLKYRRIGGRGRGRGRRSMRRKRRRRRTTTMMMATMMMMMGGEGKMINDKDDRQ
jgi:hypothetical protein